MSLRPEVLRHTTRSSSKAHLESTDSNPNFQDVKVQTHVDLKFKLLNALNITSPNVTSSMKTLVQAQESCRRKHATRMNHVYVALNACVSQTQYLDEMLVRGKGWCWTV